MTQPFQNNGQRPFVSSNICSAVGNNFDTVVVSGFSTFIRPGQVADFFNLKEGHCVCVSTNDNPPNVVLRFSSPVVAQNVVLRYNNANIYGQKLKIIPANIWQKDKPRNTTHFAQIPPLMKNNMPTATHNVQARKTQAPLLADMRPMVGRSILNFARALLLETQRNIIQNGAGIQRHKQPCRPQRQSASDRRSPILNQRKNVDMKNSTMSSKPSNMHRIVDKSGANDDDESSPLARKQAECPNDKSCNLNDETEGAIITRRKRCGVRRGKDIIQQSDSASRIHTAASTESIAEKSRSTEKSKDENGQTPLERRTEDRNGKNESLTSKNDKKVDEMGSYRTTEKLTDGVDKNIIGEGNKTTMSKNSGAEPQGPTDAIENTSSEAKNQKSFQGLETVKNCPTSKNIDSGKEGHKATPKDLGVGNNSPFDSVKSKNESTKSKESSGNVKTKKKCLSSKLGKDIGVEGRKFGSKRENHSKGCKTKLHTAMERRPASSRNNVVDGKFTSNSNASDSKECAVGRCHSKTKSKSERSTPGPDRGKVCLTERSSVKDGESGGSIEAEKHSSEGSSVGNENHTSVSKDSESKMEEDNESGKTNNNTDSGSKNKSSRISNNTSCSSNKNNKSSSSINSFNNMNDKTKVEVNSSKNNKTSQKKSSFSSDAARHRYGKSEHGRTYRDYYWEKVRYRRRHGELPNRSRTLSPIRTRRDNKNLGNGMSTVSSRSPNGNLRKDDFAEKKVSRESTKSSLSLNEKPVKDRSQGSKESKNVDLRKSGDSNCSQNRNSRASSPRSKNTNGSGERMTSGQSRSPRHNVECTRKRGLGSTTAGNVSSKRRCLEDKSTSNKDKVNPKRLVENKDLRIVLINEKLGESKAVVTKEKDSITNDSEKRSNDNNPRKESNARNSGAVKKPKENDCTVRKSDIDKSTDNCAVPLTSNVLTTCDTKMESSTNLDNKASTVEKACPVSNKQISNDGMVLEGITTTVDTVNNSDTLMDSSKNLEEKVNYMNQKYCDDTNLAKEEKILKNSDTLKDFSTGTNQGSKSVNENKPEKDKMSVEGNKDNQPLKNYDKLKGSLSGSNLEDSGLSSTKCFAAVKSNKGDSGLGIGNEQRIECTLKTSQTLSDCLSKEDKEKVGDHYNGKNKFTCTLLNADSLVDEDRKSVELKAKERVQIRNEMFDLGKNGESSFNGSVLSTASASKTDSDTADKQLENDKKHECQSLPVPKVHLNETLDNDRAKKVLISKVQVGTNSESVASTTTTLKNQKGAVLGNNKVILAKLKSLKTNANKALRNFSDANKASSVARSASIEMESNGKEQRDENASARLLTTGGGSVSEWKSKEFEQRVGTFVDNQVSMVSNSMACEKHSSDQKSAADLSHNKPVPALNAKHQNTAEERLEFECSPATKANEKFPSVSSQNYIGCTNSQIPTNATPSISSSSIPENSRVDAVKNADAKVALIKGSETFKHPSDLKQDGILNIQEKNQKLIPAKSKATTVSQKLLDSDKMQNNNGLNSGETVDSAVAMSNIFVSSKNHTDCKQYSSLQAQTSTGARICTFSQLSLNFNRQKGKSTVENANQPKDVPKSIVPNSKCKQDNGGLGTKEENQQKTSGEFTNIVNIPNENQARFDDAGETNHTKDMQKSFVDNKKFLLGKVDCEVIKTEESNTETSVGQTNVRESQGKHTNRFDNAMKSTMKAPESCVHQEQDNQSQKSTKQISASDLARENGARYRNDENINLYTKDMLHIACDMNSSNDKQDSGLHKNDEDKSETSIEQINASDRLAEKEDQSDKSRTANDTNVSKDVQDTCTPSQDALNSKEDSYENKDNQSQTAGITAVSSDIARPVGDRAGFSNIDNSINDSLPADTKPASRLHFSQDFSSKLKSGDHTAKRNELMGSSNESERIATGIVDYSEKFPVSAKEETICKFDKTPAKDRILELTKSKGISSIVKGSSSSAGDLQDSKKCDVEQSKDASSTANSNVPELKQVTQRLNDEGLAKDNSFDFAESNAPENTEETGLTKSAKDSRFDLTSNAFAGKKPSHNSDRLMPESSSLTKNSISGLDFEQVEGLKSQKPSSKDNLEVKKSSKENVLDRPTTSSSSFQQLEKSSSASSTKRVTDSERGNMLNIEDLLKKMRKNSEKFSSEVRSMNCDLQKTESSSNLDPRPINSYRACSKSADTTGTQFVSNQGNNDKLKDVETVKIESEKLEEGSMVDVSKTCHNVVDSVPRAVLNSGLIDRKPIPILSTPVQFPGAQIQTNTLGMWQSNFSRLAAFNPRYNSFANLRNYMYSLPNPAARLQFIAQNIAQFSMANVHSVTPNNSCKKKKKARRKESKNQRKKRLNSMRNQQSAQQGTAVNAQHGKCGNVNNNICTSQDSKVNCQGIENGGNFVQSGKGLANNTSTLCSQANYQRTNSGGNFVESGNSLSNKDEGQMFNQSNQSVLKESFPSQVLNNDNYSVQFQIGEDLSEAPLCGREGGNVGEKSSQNAKSFSQGNNEQPKWKYPIQSSQENVMEACQDSCHRNDYGDSVVQNEKKINQNDGERALEDASKNFKDVLKQADQSHGENSVQCGKSVICRENEIASNNQQYVQDVLKQAFQIDLDSFNAVNYVQIGPQGVSRGDSTQDTAFLGKRKREDETEVSGNKHQKCDNKMKNTCLNEVQNNHGSGQVPDDQNRKMSWKERQFLELQRWGLRKKLKSINQRYGNESFALLKSVKTLARADPSLTEKLKDVFKESLAEIGQKLIGELHELKKENDERWSNFIMGKGKLTVQDNPKNKQKRSGKINVPQNQSAKKQKSASDGSQNKPQKQPNMSKSNAAKSKPKNSRQKGTIVNQPKGISYVTQNRRKSTEERSC